MIKISLGILLFTCLYGYSCQDDESACRGISCPPKQTKLEKVDMKRYCGKTYTLDSSSAAISLVPSVFSWTPITPCTNCAVTLETEAGDQRLLSVFYSLGLSSGTDGACSLARLDIFDGAGTSGSSRLSGPGGICGYRLPNTTYGSSNNSLTVRLTTPCHLSKSKGLRRYTFGYFEMVVSSYKAEDSYCPGQFQCASGQCINKDLVCNGQGDCPDYSDETACPSVSPTFPTWGLILLILIALATLILASYVIFLLCTGCCVCVGAAGYQKV